MTFDPVAKERELAAQSSSWDTSTSAPASDGDIPIIDVGPYFSTGARSDLDAVASELRQAAENVLMEKWIPADRREALRKHLQLR